MNEWPSSTVTEMNYYNKTLNGLLAIPLPRGGGQSLSNDLLCVLPV